MNGEFVYLTRGNTSGAIYVYNKVRSQIWFSENFGNDFNLTNILNLSGIYNNSIVGGRQEGELFFILNFINLNWQNAHIYLYHSTDYGITFEVFHPFSKGNEPVLANFSTVTQEGNQPLEVEFCNYSIGDILEYQWDFDNDGEIDSYEQTPTHIYPDTGYYSVKLTIIGNDSSNTFLREDYIHVKKLVGLDKQNCTSEIRCYPNPFYNQIKIEIDDFEANYEIVIFNNLGKSIKRLIFQKHNELLIWDGTDLYGNKCEPGIYFIKAKDKTYSQKILLTN